MEVEMWRGSWQVDLCQMTQMSQDVHVIDTDNTKEGWMEGEQAEKIRVKIKRLRERLLPKVKGRKRSLKRHCP
jgi:hypothetical protein